MLTIDQLATGLRRIFMSSENSFWSYVNAVRAKAVGTIGYFDELDEWEQAFKFAEFFDGAKRCVPKRSSIELALTIAHQQINARQPCLLQVRGSIGPGIYQNKLTLIFCAGEDMVESDPVYFADFPQRYDRIRGDLEIDSQILSSFFDSFINGCLRPYGLDMPRGITGRLRDQL